MEDIRGQVAFKQRRLEREAEHYRLSRAETSRLSVRWRQGLGDALAMVWQRNEEPASGRKLSAFSPMQGIVARFLPSPRLTET